MTAEKAKELAHPYGPDMVALREAKGWAGREFARQLGMLPETYRLKEVGKSGVTGAELARMARACGVPLMEAFPSYEPTEGERALAEELGEVA